MKPENRHIDDFNYEELLEKNYTDLPNKSYSATKPKEEVIDLDFMKTSQNFWLNHEGGKYYPIYNEGVMSGTFNTRQPTFNAVLETTLESFKNILRLACEDEDKTLEDFALYFDMLENSLTLLSNKVDTTLDKRISGELIMAYLQAVFNAFITTNIKQKD